MTEDGCKVCRSLDAHGSDWMEAELKRRWQGEDRERLGYRRCARWLNVTLLEHAMERAGMPTEGGEAASRYDRLAGDDDDVAAGVRRLLRDGGLPIDELESAFVSYGSVRTHLLDCLDAERPPEDSSDWEADAIDVARQQATERASAAVRARYNKGRLAAGGQPEVAVSISVRCPTCGTTADATEALDAGKLCSCGDDSSPE